MRCLNGLIDLPFRMRGFEFLHVFLQKDQPRWNQIRLTSTSEASVSSPREISGSWGMEILERFDQRDEPTPFMRSQRFISWAGTTSGSRSFLRPLVEMKLGNSVCVETTRYAIRLSNQGRWNSPRQGQKRLRTFGEWKEFQKHLKVSFESDAWSFQGRFRATRYDWTVGSKREEW